MKAAALEQCNIRMPRWAIEAFGAWAKEQNEAVGFEKFTRSDLMRDAILDALKRREDEKKTEKRGKGK